MDGRYQRRGTTTISGSRVRIPTMTGRTMGTGTTRGRARGRRTRSLPRLVVDVSADGIVDAAGGCRELALWRGIGTLRASAPSTFLLA